MKARFTSWDLCGDDPNPISHEEMATLKGIVQQLEESPTIINIGAERGTSTLGMLEERPTATIYSIDVGECRGEFENILRAGYATDKVRRIQGRSQEVGKETPEKSIDLIFVDGDHSYAGVKGDIENWKDKVKEGGYLIFHDYIPDPIPAHIKGRAAYAIDEWRKTDTDFEEIAWTQRLKVYQRRSTS